MTYFFRNRQWKKFKSRFLLTDEEKDLRRKYSQRKIRRHIVFIVLFAVCAALFYLFSANMNLNSVSSQIFSFENDFIFSVISAVAGVFSAYFAFFPPKPKINEATRQKVKSFSHRVPKYFVDVQCQDINPADDAEKDPVRQSLREIVWKWLFDPTLTKKSYLLLLGDFGTGKTTFCFYIAHEIITAMLSFDVEVIELGQEDLDLKEKLSEIKSHERKKTILILDAYDEYYKRGRSENEFLELRELSTNFLKVIITSRTNYFACREAEPILATRYVSYFNEQQVQYFFKMNYPFHWKRNWELIKRHQQFTDLSRRVVLLNYLNSNILKSIEREEKKGIQLNNYRIYSQIVENILPDDRNPNRLLPRSQAINIMSLLGFHIICCDGPIQIHYDTMGKQLLDLLERFHLAETEMAQYFKQELLNQVSELICEIRTRTFLVRDNPGFYRFAHRSFAEYFAARFIIEIILTKNIYSQQVKFNISAAVLKFLEEAKTNKESLAKIINMIKPAFRTEPAMLSSDQVKTILQKLNFFDSTWNPEGHGCSNYYLQQTIAGDEVVCDIATGLMWQQGDSPKSMEYEPAKKWIADLNKKGYAGYQDWRLPTLEEAMSLMEPEMINGDLYIDPVFDSNQRWIWTCDPVQGGSSAWVVYFGSGGCYGSRFDDDYFVRAVRFGQSSP